MSYPINNLALARRRKNKISRFFVLFICILNASLFISCGEKDSDEKLLKTLLPLLQEKNYSALQEIEISKKKILDSASPELSYYLALHYIAADNQEFAKQLLQKGSQSSSSLISSLCAQEFINLGSKEEQVVTLEKHCILYPADKKASAKLARLYYEQNQYEATLKITGLPPIEELKNPPRTLFSEDTAKKLKIREQIDTENQLSLLRLLCLLKTDNTLFFDYLESWFLNWEITSYHHAFYKEWKQTNFSVPATASTQTDVSKAQKEDLLTCIKMRVDVYGKNYFQAVEYTKNMKNPLNFSEQLLSDYGKAYLYGSNDTKNQALRFSSLAQKATKPYATYITWFYAGRLAVKAGMYQEGMSYLKNAMNSAVSPENYDNSLWYYFDAAKRISVETVLTAIQQYGRSINFSSYFDDFFDNILTSFLAVKDWNSIVKLYTVTKDIVSGKSSSQISYLAARLIELNYVPNPFFHISVETVIKDAYQNAFSADHSSLYYRVLAAERLSIPIEDVSETFLVRKKAENFVQNIEMENLLLGYAKYGFPEKVYPLFVREAQSISIEVASQLSQQVASFGEKKSVLYSDSLRIMAAATVQVDQPLTREMLKLLYPRPYLAEVQTAAKEFKLEEHVLYGLIRSESFFERDVVSHAGAIGLSQLMTTTAQDIARRLKVTDYDLLNAGTNIRFGAYYFRELLNRLDGSVILSLFSYNGGITRVRSWVKTNKLPMDIFLETVPLAETREYGRKVLSAAVLYGYLYYDKTSHQVVNEILQ